MPFFEPTYTYQPTLFFKNRHVNSIYTAMCRPHRVEPYLREKIDTPDGDFILLDWAKQTPANRKLAILLHGLEGDTHRPYMGSMIRRLRQLGFDALGINYRTCGGEINRTPTTYHSGWTADLHFMVQQLEQSAQYEQIVLVGFSAGGNIVLKYAGERGEAISPLISHVVALSTPCDLASCCEVIKKSFNRVYEEHFMHSLRKKAYAKAAQFPEIFDLEKIRKAKHFSDFDKEMTCKTFGFSTPADYYREASSRFYLPHIRVKSLLINAADDPFLSPECYPTEVAAQNDFFYLHIPRYGGHLGFWGEDNNHFLWSDHQTAAFIAS